MSERTNRKPIREKLYVQVLEADKTPVFVDVSSSIGKRVSFTKPIATAALRVTSDAVFISCLKLSTRTRASFLSRELSLPPGPLARLERAVDGAETPLAENTVIAKLDDKSYTFTTRKDDADIVTLDLADADEEDSVIELPKTGIVVTLLLPGPKERTIVVGWTGYVNKPGTRDTITRIVAQVLNHICGLAAFQTLTGFAKVKVPASAGRLTLATPERKPGDKVTVVIPTQLWPHGGGESVGLGAVNMTVDLDDANATTNRLLLHISPDKTLEPVFDPYRNTLETVLHNEILGQYGHDELDNLICDIVLGELTEVQIQRLKDATVRLPGGIQMSPQQGFINADHHAAG
jgi:hypothetical protein